MAFTHTQHVMRNGLSASSNLDQKSLKSLINGYFYMTIFQISKRLNRAKMHSISYIGCKKVYSNIDHPGRKLSNRTSGTAWNEPWSRRTSTTLTRIVVKERETERKKSRWMLVGARDDFLSEERVLRQTNAVMNWDRWCNYGQRRL